MARFKNVSGEELLLFARGGQADSLPVPPDGVVDVPGEVTAELADGVVVGDGADARAWPSALWQLEGGDDTGVQAPQFDEHTAAEAERLANERAAANVAASEGTPADRAAQATADQDGAAARGTTKKGE